MKKKRRVLIRPNNTADVARRWLRCSRFLGIFFGGVFLGSGNDIYVFNSRTSIKEYCDVIFRKEISGAQFLIGNQRRGPFRRSKDAFSLRPVLDCSQNLVVADRDRYSLRLFQYVQNDVVAVR